MPNISPRCGQASARAPRRPDAPVRSETPAEAAACGPGCRRRRRPLLHRSPGTRVALRRCARTGLPPYSEASGHRLAALRPRTRHSGIALLAAEALSLSGLLLRRCERYRSLARSSRPARHPGLAEGRSGQRDGLSPCSSTEHGATTLTSLCPARQWGSGRPDQLTASSRTAARRTVPCPAPSCDAGRRAWPIRRSILPPHLWPTAASSSCATNRAPPC